MGNAGGDMAAIENAIRGYDIMRTYKVFFKGKDITIQAASLADAKAQAVTAFKPNKRDIGLVAVVLADVPINTAGI